jgi:hypothetical protein
LVHFSEALFLEIGIAHSKNFIDDKNLRLEVSGDSEGQSYIHSRRITLYWGVKELLDLSECDNLIKFPPDLGSRHAEDGTVEKYVLASTELGMKASTDLKQARYSAAQGNAAHGRFDNPAQDLQEGALTRAVSANNAKDLAVAYLEADVLERPVLLNGVALHDLPTAH